MKRGSHSLRGKRFFLRFRSKEQGTGFSVLAARKMNERKRPRSCSIFRPAKTEIPIPRSFFFAPKPQGNLLRRLKKPGPQACKQAPWGRTPKSSPESLLKGLELWFFART